MKNKKILYAFLFMVAFAIVSGLFVRFTITSHAQGNIATSLDVTEVTTEDILHTDTDATLYLSSKYDSATIGDIYSMLLSIRNVLIMFFGFWFMAWVWVRMKVFIKLLYRGKRK